MASGMHNLLFDNKTARVMGNFAMLRIPHGLNDDESTTKGFGQSRSPHEPGVIIAGFAGSSKPGRQITAVRPDPALRQFSQSTLHDLRLHPHRHPVRIGGEPDPDIAFVQKNTLKRHDHHHAGPFPPAPPALHGFRPTHVHFGSWLS